MNHNLMNRINHDILLQKRRDLCFTLRDDPVFIRYQNEIANLQKQRELLYQSEKTLHAECENYMAQKYPVEYIPPIN